MQSRGWASAPRWFCAGAVLFLSVRVGIAVVQGLSWGLPGDGWRSVWQLAVVAVSAVGFLQPRATRTAVLVVGLTYAVATVLELFHGTDLFGVIPVDMRDRVIHPLVAVLTLGALAAANAAQRRTTTVRT